MDVGCVLANATLSSGFCAFALGVEILKPRTILSTGTTNLLALERITSSVVFLFDSDGDAIPDSKRTLLNATTTLNHGLALNDGYIYASSDSVVYRWSTNGDEENFTSIGDEEVVVENINVNSTGGFPDGHKTRTLAFDDVGRLYISVGSVEQVDQDSFRARIRRFNLTDGIPQDFEMGEVFADGLRNEVGLAFDRHGVLWGVENGADGLQRQDLGGDIHEDNPAEELNQFREENAGKHWGYPYCWSEYTLPDQFTKGRGSVWAWPTFLDAGLITDDQCRQDYMPAAVSMQAHSAPLGITFYKWKNPGELPTSCMSGAFPEEMDGYAFIAFHGSFNRTIPTGHKVVYVQMDKNGTAVGEPVDLLAHAGPDAQWEDGFRPVDVDFDACGRLLLSSDGTGSSTDGAKIVRIEYHPEEVPSGAPTSTTSSGTAPTTSPTTSSPSDGGRTFQPVSSSTAGLHSPLSMLVVAALLASIAYW